MDVTSLLTALGALLVQPGSRVSQSSAGVADEVL